MKSSLGNKEIMSKNIIKYMTLHNKSRNDMCEALGVKYTTFTDWIKGNSYPRIDKIELMANYFGISKADLVEEETNNSVKGIRIPVYGKVIAGYPVDAVENIIDYEEIPNTWTGEYGALKVKGDSMQPVLVEGDTLIVKRQPDAESGDIVVALINGSEATVKKLIKNPDGIVLQPFNPMYEPLYFSKEKAQMIPVEIWGKVVESRHKF